MVVSWLAATAAFFLLSASTSFFSPAMKSLRVDWSSLGACSAWID